MRRGSHRQDVPLNRNFGDWVNYDCPVESWEYWEKLFGQEFPPDLRNEIAHYLSWLRAHRNAYNHPTPAHTGQRLDAKQIKRDLKKVIKNGVYFNETIKHFIEIHSTDLPDANATEKAGYVLNEFSENSEDFLIQRHLPEPMFTCEFYSLFQRHGLNVSLGSAGTLFGKGGMDAKAREKSAPETPFVEFVRRCVWKAPNSSASFCAKISGEIREHKKQTTR